MELLLNIVWLVITLAALGRLAVWAERETDRRRVVQVALATVCSLALLFPIISVTDDLQSAVATVEETVTVRRMVASAALHLVAALAAILAFVYSLIISLPVLVLVTGHTFALPASPVRSVVLLRGPPALV